VRVLLCCVHSLISVIDKLLTYIYIYIYIYTCAATTGFCWIFKLIREELMSSTHYRETWNSFKACRTCSKGNFNHSCAISVSFDDFLRYQVMKNLANIFLVGQGLKAVQVRDCSISHENLTFRAVQVSSTRYFYF
jgi:hypothetical protein